MSSDEMTDTPIVLAARALRKVQSGADDFGALDPAARDLLINIVITVLDAAGLMPAAGDIAARCEEIADGLFPEYASKLSERDRRFAKEWMASFNGAYVALGGDPEALVDDRR